MILDGRKYEKLVEENNRLVKENEKLKERYEELRRAYDRVYTNNFLDEFEYAALFPKDSHTLKVWNQGRFEENVFSVEVGQERGCMPYLKIEK